MLMGDDIAEEEVAAVAVGDGGGGRIVVVAAGDVAGVRDSPSLSRSLESDESPLISTSTTSVGHKSAHVTSS